jgi:hypothetical protein
MRTPYLLALCVACGGSQQQRPQGEQHSWTEHMERAERLDERAAEHERAATAAEGALGDFAFDCGNPVLNEQLTTGGLPITRWEPCLDLEYQSSRNHRRAAERTRDQAREERRKAAALAEAERTACQGLDPGEPSPFADRSAIIRAVPLHAEDGLAGVRVVLREQRDVTAASVEAGIRCRQAHWAMRGADPQYAPFDPTLVEGARVQVQERGQRVEVIVRVADPGQAQLALARARGELVEQTARR